MTIKVKCKTCLKELEVPDSFAGKQGKCPFCGEILDVPPDPAVDSIRIEGEEPPPPRPEPMVQPTVSAPKLSIPSTSKKRLRLSVVIPSGIVTVAAVIATILLNMQLSQPSGEYDIKVRRPVNKPPIKKPAEPASQAVENPAEKVAEAAPEPVRDVRPAMGLPATTSQYVEMRKPLEAFLKYAALPIWKDRGDAQRRCKAAYKLLMQRISGELSIGQPVTEHLMAQSKAVYIGRQPGGNSILIAEQEQPASRDAIFGNFEAADYRQTENVAGSAIEVFGEGGNRFYCGYYGKFGVLGSSPEVVSAVLQRFANSQSESLASNPELARRLDGSGSSFRLVALGDGIDPGIEFLQGVHVKQLDINETGRLHIVAAAAGNSPLRAFASGEPKDISPFVRQQLPAAAVVLADSVSYKTTVAAEKDGTVDIEAGPEFAAIAIAKATLHAEQQAAPQANAAQLQAQCKKRIEAISDAVNKFVGADLDTFQYPRGLNELLEAELLTPDDLLCPAEKQSVQTGQGVASSYELLFDKVNFRLPGGFSTKALIVWEKNPDHNGKHMAIFVDGKIKLLTDAELQAAVKSALDEVAQSAPRKVNIPTR